MSIERPAETPNKNEVYKEDPLLAVAEVDLRDNPEYPYLHEGLAAWQELSRRRHYFDDDLYKTERFGSRVDLGIKVREFFLTGEASFGHQLPKELASFLRSQEGANVDDATFLEQHGLSYIRHINKMSSVGSKEIALLPEFAPENKEPPSTQECLDVLFKEASAIESAHGIDSKEFEEFKVQAMRAGASAYLLDFSPEFSRFAEAYYQRFGKGSYDERSIHYMSIDAYLNGRLCAPRHIIEHVNKGNLLRYGFDRNTQAFGLFELERLFGMSEEETDKYANVLKEDKSLLQFEERIGADWKPQHPQELLLMARACCNAMQPLATLLIEGNDKPVSLETIGADALNINYQLSRARRDEFNLKKLPMQPTPVNFDRAFRFPIYPADVDFPEWFHYRVTKRDEADGSVTFEIRPR